MGEKAKQSVKLLRLSCSYSRYYYYKTKNIICMKNMKWFSWAMLCVGGAILAFSACQKSASSSSSIPANKQQFNMYLTDGPVNFQEVLIDIKSIEVFVKTDSCTASGFIGSDSTFPCYHWDTLNITPGVYNILDFQNGVDTLFASSNIDKGKILELRLNLGDSNYVVADSVKFKLDLLWGKTFNVLVNDVQQVNENTFQLWFDFDAAHSIITVDREHFALKPYIRLFTRANSGNLEGAVQPGAADAFVSVVDGSDTLIALPGRNGRFEVCGIKNTSVNVTVYATGNNYQDTTLNNVSITPGTTTNLGTLTLHQ